MSTNFYIYSLEDQPILSPKKLNNIRKNNSSEKLKELNTVSLNVNMTESCHKISMSDNLDKIENVEKVSSVDSPSGQRDLIVGKMNGVFSLKTSSNTFYYCDKCIGLTDSYTNLCVYCYRSVCSDHAKQITICLDCQDKPFY